MSSSIASIPHPVNEPVCGYAPGTPERARLESEMARQAAPVVEIPCVVGGRRIFTGNVREVLDKKRAAGRLPVNIAEEKV